MSIKTKRIIRCICFLGCVILTLLPFIILFGYPAMDENSRSGKMRFEQFYEEQENTLQGVLIGTSSVHREWAAPVAYEEYGIAMYPLSSSAQPLSLAIPILREAKETQDIDYALVDLRGIRMNSLGKSEETIRHCLDNMPFSVNKIRSVNQILDYNQTYNALAEEDRQVTYDRLSLYFPFLKYHDRWSSGVTAEDFTMTSLDMKGVADDEQGFEVMQVKHFGVSYDKSVQLNELQKQVLDDLITYAQEEDITLIFFSSPSSMGKGGRSQVHAAQNYLEDQGFDVADMVTKKAFREIGIDFNEDYRDPQHFNLKGAVKFTRYFCEYLKAHYDIPDVREQKGYESWDIACDTFWEFYKEGWKRKENT